MKLSEHFSLEELTVTNQQGLDNTPDQEIIENLTRLAAFLEDVRKVLGNRPIMINSGYRSPGVNKAVGGSIKSKHMFGLAADIHVKDMTPDEVVKAIRDSSLEYDQVIREYDRWTHIGIAELEDSPRKMALIIDDQGTRSYA
ncbi:MAG: DUF882 domain-containing protein [Magnetococcales bacterium]|nr:DUF882 domain-containing protein [Magnetococcales bacterium]NGZ27072.1 DUF882 domain-containing protein [Magnetococcales bacterium]